MTDDPKISANPEEDLAEAFKRLLESKTAAFGSAVLYPSTKAPLILDVMGADAASRVYAAAFAKSTGPNAHVRHASAADTVHDFARLLLEEIRGND